MRNQKLDPLALKVALEREQTELFGRLQSEFWQGLFCDILKKHTYQNKKATMDELSIIVCQKDITMRILPHNPLLKLFWLEEYQLVENIVKEMCQQLFENQKEKFLELRENYKVISASAEGLTSKTIEIAQNTIKTLYEASCEKNRNLVQRKLYSSMLYKGRMIRIFHRDFMNDPSVLKKELES